MRYSKRRLKRWAERLTSTFTTRRSRDATYSFYHGRPTSNGVFYWRFVELPDKERIELTQQRDVAYVYFADKGYEITYKGARDVEKKDLDDYLRHRRFSSDAMSACLDERPDRSVVL